VRVYTEAPPEMIEDRTILLAPLLCRSFTSVENLLRKYSKRQDGSLDTPGLKALASDIQKKGKPTLPHPRRGKEGAARPTAN